MKKKYDLTSICLFVCLMLSTLGLCGCSKIESQDEDIFSAQYIRTYHEISNKEAQAALIQTKEELDAFISKNIDTSVDVDFLDACAKYTKEYFSDNVLVIIPRMENSGAISHKITGAVYQDNTIYFTINREVPDILSADMMGWHIIVELKDVEGLPSDTAIDVTYVDVKPEGFWWLDWF